MNKWVTCILWLIPLSLHSAHAHAWGLLTHVYFAQYLVWMVPLADPRLRRVIRSFPGLVMAGACLPDLSLFGRLAGTQAFADNHHWHTAEKLYNNARDVREQALAIGYASHLLVDVIAHNHFVPSHEILWVDIPGATHIVSEWAMDAYILPHLKAAPAGLLHKEKNHLQEYVAHHFGCTPKQAHTALTALAKGEHLLRRARVPHALYRVARTMDRPVQRRFEHYITSTTELLPQLERVIKGEVPFWQAEAACRNTAQEEIRQHPPRKIRWRLPLPGNLFL